MLVWNIYCPAPRLFWLAAGGLTLKLVIGWLEKGFPVRRRHYKTFIDQEALRMMFAAIINFFECGCYVLFLVEGELKLVSCFLFLFWGGIWFFFFERRGGLEL